MKFAILALVAYVRAQDDEEGGDDIEALEAGADCSAEDAVCGDGLCCGVATAAGGDDEEEQGGDDEEEEAAGNLICNDETADAWENEDGDSFDFACEEEGASKLAMGAALIASAYLLA